ncbi:MAG: family 20 glycosylhydrolase [Sedimentisphaerales bacterium]|nr:family 20 glycosylhydrolase [Sedimentisphaerales bacterium]
MSRLLVCFVVFVFVLSSTLWAEQKVYLDEMDAFLFSTGWGNVNKNKAVSGNTLSIAGIKYDRGIGLHAVSVGQINLKGSAISFNALVGADDGNTGSVRFIVKADGEVLFKSEVMNKGIPAAAVNVDLIGKKTLELIVADGGNGTGRDHADWVNAYISYSGDKPEMVMPPKEAPSAFVPAIPLEKLKAARKALIPYPKVAHWQDNDFSAPKITICFLEQDVQVTANALSSLIEALLAENFTAFEISLIKNAKPLPENSILLHVGEVRDSKSREAYTLNVERNGIIITAPDSAGLFYGVQTLRQLWQTEQEFEVPCCNIVDYPTFMIRGFMHDCGRNFQTIASLKEQMKIFALYKLNVFHWHLTDNPAWRIECQKYPQLNDPKNHRPGRDPGKFYSYEQINDFFDYCKRLHIQVIPEIDMPGHSEYFPVAMGFKMHTEEGMAVLKDCLQEFFENVPLAKAPIIHLGSDEVRIPNPKEFIETMTGYVNDHGREVMIWSPGLKGTASTIKQFWGGSREPDPTVRCIDSTNGYVNGVSYYSAVSRNFFHQPCRVERGNDKALGAILCHWPDIRVDVKANIFRHSPVYPSLISFSEMIWVGRKTHNPLYGSNLPVNDILALELFQEFESRLAAHRDRFFKNKPFRFVKHSQIQWALIGPFDHGGDTTKVFAPENSIAPEYEVDGKLYKWTKAGGGEIYITEQKLSGPPSPTSTVYAMTWIKSPIVQTVPFMIGFEFPDRSNRQYRGLPAPGQWDANGGTISINDKPLLGPQWINPGKFENLKATWHTPQNEIPLTDEELYWTRPLTNIELKKGWNKVLIKCPRSYNEQKWIFAFIPVDISGPTLKAFPGLEFSTEKP